MATYILINTIRFGNSNLKSGSRIDSNSINVTQIQYAGGTLVATGVTVLDEAAEVVRGMWRDGKGQDACDAAMMAVYSKYNADYEVAHDTVVANGTGIAATNAGSAHGHSIGTSGTPTITVDKLRMQQNLGVLAAPGTAYHAQYAAGAAIDDVGPFAIFVPPRTVQIARGGVGSATVYTIDGTDPAGAALQEILNSAGAATVQGTRAFATVTRIRSDVDPGVTTDLQTGNGFGLACVASDIDRVGLDGGNEAPTSTHADTGTVIPQTAPNGAHIYSVDYRVLPTATQAAHDHGAATGNESAHTHGLPATTHTHTLS